LRERRFRALTDNATDLILVLDRRGWASYASHSFTALLGCEPGDLLANGYRKMFEPRSCALLLAAVDRAAGGTTAPQRFELEVTHRDGSSHVLDATATSALADPAVRGLILNARDISERRWVEAQLASQTSHDALTGLPNRSLLHSRLQNALAHATRETSRVALLLIDLDRFKDVNDALGHQMGDALLCEVANRLRRYVRDTDFAARLGADEFAVVIAGTDVDDANVIAERLITSLCRPYNVRTQTIAVTASVGIALGEGDSSAASLLRQADVAMYSAKRRRSGIAIFTRHDDDRALDRLKMASALPSAIANDELVLHYQPQIHVPSGAVNGVEALVRWQHPERGMVPPGEFIGVAEETGLILPLTDWVLECACRNLREWSDAGLPAIPLSVNLAAPSLAGVTLVSKLDGLMQRFGLQPERLILEMTESILMHDVESGVALLQTLRDRGYGLSLDDFGTGYSSLSYLKRLPLDELKVDRAFVTDAERGGRDGALAATIIALGRELGLRVVAEGVETREQSAFLLRRGCNVQQGYLFSRPVAATAFAHLLKAGFVEVPDLAASGPD
jgi:diguanylate cyclase (GGDEF)-like protein/PAS domain S-box-containing protein